MGLIDRAQALRCSVETVPPGMIDPEEEDRVTPPLPGALSRPSERSQYLVESKSILLKRHGTRKSERSIGVKGRSPCEPVCACAPAINQLPIGVERNLLVCFRPLTSAFCVCLSCLFPTPFVQALLLTWDNRMDVTPSIPKRSLISSFQKFIWF
jgi:hypothetical protein